MVRKLAAALLTWGRERSALTDCSKDTHFLHEEGPQARALGLAPFAVFLGASSALFVVFGASPALSVVVFQHLRQPPQFLKSAANRTQSII